MKPPGSMITPLGNIRMSDEHTIVQAAREVSDDEAHAAQQRLDELASRMRPGAAKPAPDAS